MRIFVNKIQTPDGTILESRHQHDYKSHVDTITGETYMVDGGTAYFRGSRNKVKPTYLHCTTKDEHTKIREHFSWGCRGINGDQPIKYILLKDLSDNHIENIVATQKHIPSHISVLFCEELVYRLDNDIRIEDGGY